MNGLALCAGGGGLELGLRLAQPTHRTVCYVEREAYAASILAARMADGSLDQAPIWDDLSTFNGRPWRGLIQILSAGFPCQPWSCAGKRQGTADPRWLWPRIAHTIRQVAPPLVFVENVFPGFLHGGLSEVLGTLAQSGYAAEWGVFSAAASGAPHLRRRVFILAAHTRRLRRHARRAGEPLPGPWAHGQVAHTQQQRQLEQPRRAGDSPSRGRRRANHTSGGRGNGARHADAPAPVADAEHGGPSVRRHRSQTDDGEAGRQDSWWAVEPDVGRVADGVASRVDRLRALGNGVVPQVAARAFATLAARLFSPPQTPFTGASNAPQAHHERSPQTQAIRPLIRRP